VGDMAANGVLKRRK
jgi:hypothetical protein